VQRRFIVSALAGAGAVLVLNGLIYALFYGDFLKDNSGLSTELFEQVQRPVADTQVVATVASMVFIGCLIATVAYWARAYTFAAGLKAGLIFGVLMIGAVNLGLIATTYYYSYISGLVDILVGALTIAVGCGFAALVQGRSQRSSQPSSSGV
jgi:hypothetical protein